MKAASNNMKEVSDELAVIFTKVSALASKVYGGDTPKELSQELDKNLAYSLMYIGAFVNKLRIAKSNNMAVAMKEITDILYKAKVDANEVIAI